MLRLIQTLTHYCISINVVMLHTSMFSFYRCFNFPSSLQSQQHSLVYSGALLICARPMKILKEIFPTTPDYLLTYSSIRKTDLLNLCHFMCHEV